MRAFLILFFSFCCHLYFFAQQTIEQTLKTFNNNTVEYVFAEELKVSKSPILLDTRKKEEYEVSHLKNAIWVGYENFEIESVLQQIPNKKETIVVYCSVGVRSEDIGEKLIEAGYTDVKNLYGGIFQWKNQGNPVYDTTENETEKVHAFSKQWGKLLTNAKKVYRSNQNP